MNMGKTYGTSDNAVEKAAGQGATAKAFPTSWLAMSASLLCSKSGTKMRVIRLTV